MSHDTRPIPVRLNLSLTLLLVGSLTALLYAAAQTTGLTLAAVALSWALLMNTAYAMLHEAEHHLLHPNRFLNDSAGALLALFFPAPFHLLRQGHIGHHLRNRSDDEAFDFYFKGENPVWKRLQLYGILTGFFWLTIVMTTALTSIWPGLLRLKKFPADRPTEALLQSLNHRFLPLVWLESVAAVALHGGLILLWDIPPWHWALLLASFGLLWSALQYVHHFGTERDVMNGALNLRSWRWLDALWLNHNWHLRHHQRPTVPWIHLPYLDEGPDTPRPRLFPAWLRMWRGPRFTRHRVSNRYAGRIIR